MTRSMTKLGLGAFMLALATLSSSLPAAAGGGLTLFIEPHGKEARMLQQGLQIYSIVSSFKRQKNYATVDQKGTDNAAALAQHGVNNTGLVLQRGRNHTATVSQAGRDNALGVFQFGKNTNLDFAQIGEGKAGLVLQGGW